MNSEELVSHLYQIAVKAIRWLNTLDKKKLTHVLSIVIRELMEQVLSWLVLTGTVARSVVEVVFLEAVLSWLAPLNGAIEK